MAGPHLATAPGSAGLAATRSVLSENLGRGGGWAEFSDRRRGWPFMPQEEAFAPGVPRSEGRHEKERRDGRFGREGAKKARENPAAQRWVRWSSTVPAASHGEERSRIVRARQGSKSKRRWAGWATCSSTPSTAAAASTVVLRFVAGLAEAVPAFYTEPVGASPQERSDSDARPGESALAGPLLFRGVRFLRS
jgi:hypothetical protein